MYSVPADLPVQRFVGDFLTQVRIGADGEHFVFDQSGIISVFGHWELMDRDGKTIDCACDLKERDAYRVHAILNQHVTGSCLAPPHSFSLTFSSGHRLTVNDDLQQYESFSIQPGNYFV